LAGNQLRGLHNSSNVTHLKQCQDSTSYTVEILIPHSLLETLFERFNFSVHKAA